MTRVVTFFLGNVLYAVDAGRVIEILRPLSITPVPGARGVVAGLINVRGQIIAAVDLRRRLGHPDGGTPMNLLVSGGDGAVSLLVDKIGDVITLDDAGLSPPPHTLPDAVRGIVTGSYPFPDRLVLILDTDRVISPEDVGGLS